VQINLLYSVRSPKDMFYAEEFAMLKSPTFAVTFVYTRETPEGWPTPPGRVSREILESATIPATESPVVFVCGPTGFVESVATWLVELGHQAETVKTERFGGA
jgi:ferredoxin-NADP reductase